MQEPQQQFEQAFEAHADELFRHAYLRLSDRERAVELTQEAFLKAWSYVQKGTEITQIRPFLFLTLRRLIIDEYRKNKAVSLEAMMHEGDESVEHLLPTDDSNTLEAAMGRYDGKKILQLLPALPEAYREALQLRYIDGLVPQEIAQVIGESENVVSVRIHRALKKLRTLLEPEPN